YRIELGEIEAALLAHEEVRSAVVLAREQRSGDKYLCAYVECGKELGAQALKTHLKAALPDYMVPAHIIRLDEMPRLSSGKIDRKALPEPDGRLRAGEYAAPRAETERKLADIWKTTLGVASVSIKDNFFELGGHSLTATGLMARIHKQFKVELPLRDIFENPTIEELSVLISRQEAATGAFSEVPPAEERDYYPVTPTQMRQMVLHQFEGAATAYNMPFALQLKGKLDVERLEQVCRELINRHEALRTSFEWIGQEPVQKIHSKAPFRLACTEIGSRGGESEASRMQTMFRAFVRPFDLGQAPLFRAELVRLSDSRHILMVDMHHIIADGTSMEILASDFTQLYHGAELPPLRIQYKDYAVWLNDWVQRGNMREKEEYWLNVFSDEVPLLNMPTDFQRPPIQTFEGERYFFQADRELAEKLTQFAAQRNTTLFMVLLSAYNVLLHKYSGQDDIVVGSPVAGRSHADLERIMGMFVNTLVLRNRPSTGKPFKQLLLEVQENALEAFKHQDYPMEELMEKLELRRDLSRNPMFDTMFSLEKIDSAGLQTGDLTIRPYSADAGIAKVDLTLTAESNKEELAFRFEYCRKLFRRETIARMSGHYLRILQAVAEHPDLRIGDLDMVTKAEQTELLALSNASTAYAATLRQLFEELAAGTLGRIAAYILDGNHRLQPIGVPGELFIAGDALAQGELKRSGLTKEGVVPNPFVPGEVMCPTGDIARWLLDGNIELLGRKSDLITATGVTIEAGARSKAGSTRTAATNVRLDLGMWYEPPTNPTEETLIRIWESVLGREGIGITHSFFDIGGDSIKAIQVIARLHQYGLKLEMKDLFQHPTIQQVSLLVKRRTRAIDQGVVKGNVRLTPIQRWFFENKKDDSHHFNQVVMLYSHRGFDEKALNSSFDAILLHHDALRMTYEIGESGVRQHNRGTPEKSVRLAVYNMQGDAGFKEKIEEEATRLQASMDLCAGELIRIGLFKTDAGDHLLIAIHHLVVDGVSWRILLEDFDTAYSQAAQGEQIVLPGRTDSFQYWADQLEEYANSQTLLAEKAYWKRIEDMEFEPLPQSRRKLADDSGARTSHTVRLNKQDTQLLLGSLHQVYHTEINDLLLAALGMAVKQWSGLDRFPINLEGHGREEIMEDIDITRTVGWFTSMFPVILDMSECGDDVSSAIRCTKETIRSIPNRGVGYGVLKYLTQVENKQELSFGIQPEITFNYLGQFMEEAGNGTFELSLLSPGRSIGGRAQNRFGLDINSIVSEDRLVIEFEYSRGEYEDNDIVLLARAYTDHLRTLINHCTGRTDSVPTPSDFQEKELSIRELDRIFLQYGGGEQISRIYPLTPMQQGMLFHYLMDPETTAYVEQVAVEIEGRMQPELMEQSFRRLLEKYEVLRTNFVYTDIRAPRQVVRMHQYASVHFEDLDRMDDNEITAYVDGYKKRDLLAGFDLSDDALIRLAALKIAQDRLILIWTFHHMIMDGWCAGIVYRDFMRMYLELVNGNALVPETAPSYSTYIRWLEKQDARKAIFYWKQVLDGYEQCAVVPKTTGSASKADYRTELLEFSLDRMLTRRLSEIASANQVTVNTLLQAIWGTLLQRYNNTNDVVFGAVVSGRPPEIPDIESMVGIFINTVPVRIQAEEDESFIQVAKRVQQNALASAKYEYTSLADIQSVSKLKQSLLDHIFVFENYPDYGEEQTMLESASLKIHVREMAFFEQTNYDFNIIVSLKEELSIKFLYNANAISGEFVGRIKDHLNGMIGQIIEDAEIRVSNIEVVTGAEKEAILRGFNDTRASYPKQKTIHQLFEEQVERMPDRTAVIFEGQRLTYRELNEQANRLASALRQSGVRPDERVALLVERSADMIAAILAVLKAGGAYVPLDPDYPEDRLQFMLDDCGAKVLVHQSHLVNKAAFAGVTLNLGDYTDMKSTVEANGYANLTPVNRSNDLAYMIYTSGTTGRPKGVMIEHRNVVRLMVNDQMPFDFSKNDVWTVFHSFCFDFSVWEMYGALLYGGACVVIPKAMAQNPMKFAQLLRRERVTVLNQTPSAFYALLQTEFDRDVRENQAGSGDEENLALRYVMFGGEVLNPAMLKYWKERYPETKLINMYGITETTVHVTYKEMRPSEIESNLSTVGAPLPTLAAYIFDKHRRLAPVGVAGELYVGGDGVARGYLNLEDLTGERFVANPYRPEERLYRSGDLARRGPNGEIEYLGRIDHQVKIRGYRIEPGEIEAALLAQEGVKAAVALAHDDLSGGKRLCAYVVAESHVTATALRQSLSLSLPEYMIPAQYVFLLQMPLTTSGKADRRALRQMNLESSRYEEYAEPRNELERQLVEVWENVLDVKNVGIDDHFFDLGGHSLTAIRLVSRLQGIVGNEVRLSSLFQYPTVRSMAQHVVEWVSDGAASVRQFNQVGTLLYDKLGLKGSMRQVQAAGELLNVLHIEEGPVLGDEEIMELLTAHFAEANQPHYIVWLPEGVFKLAKANTADIRSEWTETIDRMQDAFSRSILGQGIVEMQPVSPTQRYHLKHTDISGTVMTFDKHVNVKHLEKAIVQIVRDQDLMRSVSVEQDGERLWQLHACPDRIPLPVIDISAFDEETKQNILDDIIWPYFYKSYDMNGALLYRMLLVRKNLKEYLLLLPFAHSIFDYMSSEIIKNRIYTYYECFRSGKDLQQETINRYWDFTAHVMEGPQDIDDTELVRMYDLPAFEDEISRIASLVESKPVCQGHTTVKWKLDYAETVNGLGDSSKWEAAFYIYSAFCQTYFGIGRAPVWVAQYGRGFGNKRYYDVIGEFVDYIPVAANPKEGSARLEKQAKEKIRLASEHHICFANLIYNPDAKDSYPLSCGHLQEAFERMPVVFNFLGELRSEHKVLQSADLGNVNVEGRKRMLCEVWYDQEDTLFMALTLPYPEDEAVVVAHLQDALEKMKKRDSGSLTIAPAQ
ncbi:amino acid adenylation domain-containing protein, partial [Paenibacillus elgii]